MMRWSEEVDQVATRHGIYRRKHRLRAVFQSTMFLALVSGYLLYNGLSEQQTGGMTRGAAESDPLLSYYRGSDHLHRELEATVSCSDIKRADPSWLCVFYSIGVLYMFLALAIVCDEFFVPALEEMSSSRRLNLSMDVAGATLMAAGGSAPELFSSLFGTFQGNDIGFGTIIGSAVFNVLFVIAMCSLFAKEVLQLTWWPLFRDSLFYAIGLVVLSVFVGVVSPERIYVWEAGVLFAMYFVYILIMWKNGQIYKALTGKELVYPEDEEKEEKEDVNTEETFVNENGNVETDEEGNVETAIDNENGNDGGDIEDQDPERPALNRVSSKESITSTLSVVNLQACLARGKSNYSFRWHGTFRTGILKLLRHPHGWVTLGGVGIVAKIAGDAEHVFKKIDENGDGHIDKDELRKLFETLEAHVSQEELDEVFDELDTNGDGVISKEEFNKWYTTSAELIRSQVRQIFDQLDTDHSGTLDKYEVKALLLELDPNVTDEDCEQAIQAMWQEGSRDEITFEEFEEWYEHSMIYERQKQAVEEDMEGVFESLKPPYGEGCLSWTQYIVVFPLVFVMAFTIPDVRRPGWGKWCYVAFVLSIAWIGFFSYLMVLWAEIIGNTIGIPPVIMGLTVLAAGTSVPDLLSSVIVARRGSGDMAVSSSIGSNIFDILVGLPVPWILYTAWPTLPDHVSIGSKNIWTSIIVLLGMLVFVIAAVHCQGWKLTKCLGAMMIVFYLGFLAQAIVLELPFDTCIP